MKNYFAGASLVFGVTSLATEVVAGVDAIVTFGGVASDIDQLTGASDQLEAGTLKTTIKVGEAGIGLMSLRGDVSDAINLPKKADFSVIKSTIGVCGSVGDVDDVKSEINK